MKRFISALCAAVTVFSAMNVCGMAPVYAADGIFEFSDDFSYYPSNTVYGTSTGDEGILSGTDGSGGFWKESEKNEKYGNGGKANITADGRLYMKSNGMYMSNVLNLVADHAEIGAAQYASVDVCTNTNSARGIRIMVDSSEKSYYSLGFTSWTNSEGDHYPVFSKVENSGTAYSKMDKSLGKWKSVWCTLEIYVSGGEVGYKITDKSNPSRVFSGVFFDDKPYALSGNDAGVQLYVTTDDDAYFDNFVYKTAVPYINIGEPGYKMYRGLNSGTSEDGTVRFSDCVPVRRILAPGLAGESTDILLSADGNTWETVTAVFDGEGNFLNTVTATPFLYVKTENDKAAEMTFLGEYDGENEIIIPKGGKYRVYATVGGVFENTSAVWNSGSDDIATVQNGEITGLHVGKTHITVSGSGAELGFDVNVLGEIGFARLNNTEQEYVLSKKETVDCLNRIIAEKDETGFLNMFRGTSDKKLSDIADLNIEEITLTDDRVRELGKRLFTYGEVRFGSLAEAEEFIGLFNRELSVGALCGVTDAAEFERAVVGNADIIGFDAEDEYYLKYKEQIIADMLGCDFLNAADAGDRLHRGTIYRAVKNSIAFAEIGDLVAGNQEYLRYDKAHFDGISDKQKLYRSILNNLEEIDSVEALVTYIDSYREQTEDSSGGGIGGGTVSGGNKGGGKGGSSSGGGGIGRVVSVPQDNTDISSLQNEGNAVKSNDLIFADVPAGSWAYEGTKYLHAIGAVSGDENLMFRPEEPITRAEFIKILLSSQKAELAAEEPADGGFADINGDEWYAPYINTAYGMGILSGDGENNAMPEKEITRQEIAAIVFRMTQKSSRELLQTAEFVSFKDEDTVASWALEAVRKLQLSGILSGDENGCFNPASNATRAEGAQIVYKLTKAREYKPETAEQSQN